MSVQMILNYIGRLGEQIKISKEHIPTHQQQPKLNIGKTWRSLYSITDGISVESIQHQNTEEQSMEHIYQEYSLQNV